MTYGEFYSQTSEKIGRREVLLLLEFVTGKNDAWLLLHKETVLGDSDFERLKGLAERRLSGEPLQYILGEWDFCGLTFKVDKRVLIPRPETELLVMEALKCPARILDVCTGSGCIAVSIKMLAEIQVDVTAVDISQDALELAAENAKRLGAEVKFVQSDLLENVVGFFDIIVSNPPYITTEEMQKLEPTVRDFEPNLALHGGFDGMDLYRRLIPQAAEKLKPGGLLLLEIGPPEVLEIMQQYGFTDIKIKNDYANLPRILTGHFQNTSLIL